jgi:hypothetical protein
VDLSGEGDPSLDTLVVDGLVGTEEEFFSLNSDGALVWVEVVL